MSLKINNNSSAKLQDLSPAVANACGAINALLTKLEHTAEKVIQYRRSIGQHMATIKKARPNDWEAIVKAECGLRRRAAYHYMAIAGGTETLEGQRAENRERVARHRALRNARAITGDADLAVTAVVGETTSAPVTNTVIVPPTVATENRTEIAGATENKIELPSLETAAADITIALDRLRVEQQRNNHLAERIRELANKMVVLEAENADLKAEIANLKAGNAALLEQIKAERKLRTRVGELLREARGLTGHLPHTGQELARKVNQAAQALADFSVIQASTDKSDPGPIPPSLVRRPAA